MWHDKDGWPFYSWYDRAAIHTLNFTMTLGWRIVNIGMWLVNKSSEVRERNYPSATGNI